MEGTVLVRFKTAFVTKLNLELTSAAASGAAAYQSPQSEEDIVGASGSGVAAWFVDDAVAAHTVPVMKGSPIWVDETASPVLRIQAIARDTDSDQADADALANTVLGYALAVLFEDPTVGLTNDTIQDFCALPASWSWQGGVQLPSNLRAARFDLTIDVEARLKLVLP